MTDIEKKTFEAIIAFKAKHEYSPTVREISDIIHRSVSTVTNSLIKLEASGYISTDNYKARTIRVLKHMCNTKIDGNAQNNLPENIRQTVLDSFMKGSEQ